MSTEYDPLPYRAVYFPLFNGYNKTEDKTMPCGGPDLEKARKGGVEIGEELLRQLIKEYKLFDLTDPKFEHFGNRAARERWEAAKAKFVEAVGDLWVEDASNSW